MSRPLEQIHHWLCWGPGGWVIFLGIICYLFVSSWAVCYKFAYGNLLHMGSGDFFLDEPSVFAKAGALTILVGLGLVRTELIVSWLAMQMRRPKHRLCGWKTVMQSDDYTRSGFYPDVPADRSFRLRFCKYVHTSRGCFDGDRPLADRVYHVTHIGKKCERDQKMRGVHLPLYDHYCHWIGAVVWLDTIKPYLLFLVFMALDALIVIASSIAAMALPARTSGLIYAPVVVLASLIVALLAFDNAWKRWKSLAFENITIQECKEVHASSGGFWFAIAMEGTGQDGEYSWFFRRYGGNPWDLGIRSNIHQAFGGLLDCLLPWTQPPRVRRYADRSQVSDFEMSEHFWKWVEEQRRERRAVLDRR
ncbi:hypothetical protein VPNG_06741 [Cytospora leucostoma]|uniref:Palmitoyltransferase n=1 Tax=Cytospora leucostoma TaxID=1230097 RepID=A0A423WT10_9PEZI|nr:hypothetical protein VPNG_06741 [Cytospora leucostoma]